MLGRSGGVGLVVQDDATRMPATSSREVALIELDDDLVTDDDFRRDF